MVRGFSAERGTIVDFTEVKIDEGFWCFEQRGVRCFLLAGKPYSLLIDACFGGDLAALCRARTEGPVRLVLTHGDRDHVGCMDQFDEVYMHPAEYAHFASKNGRDPQVRPLWEGDRLQIGACCLEVLHLPGHTPGSVALLERYRRLLLAGDCVQAAPVYMFGPGRNMAAYRDSLTRLLARRGEFDVIYPSHGPMTVPPSLAEELRDFAAEADAGLLPPPLPLPDPLPAGAGREVRLYRRGNAQFYL